MATQPPITSFFGSKKRRAAEGLERNAKLMKGDPTLLKITKLEFKNVSEEVLTTVVPAEQHAPTKSVEPTTPIKKNTCDIRSFMTSKSPFRPECKSATKITVFRVDGKAKDNETTPVKVPGSIMKSQASVRPPSAVKKSIRFEDDKPATVTSETVENPPPPSEMVETDDIIQAANDLVEKIKNKSQSLSDIGKTSKKQQPMTAGQLKKKLARSEKLSELKSSLSKLGKHASELIKLEKKKKEIDQPKITKFESFEVDVPRSPHKGALASPVKSPAKPAYERFAHLINRTGPAAGASSLPLPLGFQRLLDLFTASDTVCSMMLNRGEIITFRKLKPAVQELTRHTLTERHLAQMATVLPGAFEFRQEKLRNFGSTSKVDRYELVLTPCVDGMQTSIVASPPSETSNLVRVADNKKMTPKNLQMRRDAFSRGLLERTMAKHEEFLAGLDPPLNVARGQLTRWHPNFPVDLVADVPPASLPEPPFVNQAPTSAKDVLERAKQLLNANVRMRNALEAASREAEPALKPSGETAENTEQKTGGGLSPEVKAAVDKRVSAHDPLKGISKSLLDRIRAKQAAKALETMKMSPLEQQELLLLTQLPDTARVLRTLFVDGQKGVLPLETVVEKVMFSSKRTIAKGDVETTLRRLITELPDWLSIFTIKSVEYLKLNRALPLAPIMDKLEKMVAERRRALS